MHDIGKLLQPIKNKIMLLIGRCILTAINNTGKTQTITGTGLSGEKLSDVERPENYGFTSSPRPSMSEAVIVFPNGNRGNGVAVVVADRDARPKTLSEGDVCIYDYRGLQILLDVTGITLKTGDALPWMPNILAVDPMTGIPHGGIGGGISRLRGA